MTYDTTQYKYGLENSDMKGWSMTDVCVCQTVDSLENTLL